MIVAVDHPLLDLVCTADDAALEAFGLAPAAQRLATPTDAVLFRSLLDKVCAKGTTELGKGSTDDVSDVSDVSDSSSDVVDSPTCAKSPPADDASHLGEVQFIPGGQGLNSLRAARWLLTARGSPAVSLCFSGCVGDDSTADLLRGECGVQNIKVDLQVVPEAETGKCACLLVDKQRTMLTELGAAPAYRLKDCELLLDGFRARTTATPAFAPPTLLFTTGFYINGDAGCVDALSSAVSRRHIRLCVGLSASWAVRNAGVLSIVRSTADVVFGNEGEMRALADALDLKPQPSDTQELVSTLAACAKPGCWFICTRGAESVICARHTARAQIAQNRNKKTRRVGLASPSPPILFEQRIPLLSKSVICDDVGAGDGFVGGFLASVHTQLMGRAHADVADETDDADEDLAPSVVRRALDEAIFTARQVMQFPGCQFGV